jgi:ABC-type transport system involved in multi-copper enzyme maturation permease subunit
LSPISEVSLVTWRELRKSFRSAKGAALAAISILGGGAVSMVFAWIDRVRREQAEAIAMAQTSTGIDPHRAQVEFFSRWYGGHANIGSLLADCPYALWMMLVATLWLAPLLVALMTFDAVSGELQRGTVRFWVVRARRSSYLIGKLLGTWLAVLAVSLAMNVIVWVTAAVIGHQSALYIVGWGLRFFAVVVPVTAAWCSIAVLIGSQVKTPMLSLMTICVAFFGFWVAHIAATFSGNEWLKWAYPSAYDALLLSPDPSDVGRGLLGIGVIIAISLGAATVAFERRDL